MFRSPGGAQWTENFQYMSAVAFDYYFDPAAGYIYSDASEHDWEFASGFLLSMALQMKKGGLASGTKEKVRSLAQYLRLNNAKFGLELNEWELSKFADIEV